MNVFVNYQTTKRHFTIEVLTRIDFKFYQKSATIVLIKIENST
jgi:hypothetical protein